MRSLHVLLALSVLFVTVPAQASQMGIDTLISWTQGTYSNERQVATARDEDAPGLLFPVFRHVAIPAFGEHVIYLQWPMETPDGDLQRQRIWAFHQEDDESFIMKFYTLKNPGLWRDAHRDPDKVREMTMDDVIAYPETCTLPILRAGDEFRTAIPPTCKIVSQNTRTAMTIQSFITIAADRMTYMEFGVAEDGKMVFQVPMSGAYVFDKLTP